METGKVLTIDRGRYPQVQRMDARDARRARQLAREADPLTDLTRTSESRRRGITLITMEEKFVAACLELAFMLEEARADDRESVLLTHYKVWRPASRPAVARDDDGVPVLRELCGLLRESFPGITAVARRIFEEGSEESHVFRVGDLKKARLKEWVARMSVLPAFEGVTIGLDNEGGWDSKALAIRAWDGRPPKGYRTPLQREVLIWVRAALWVIGVLGAMAAFVWFLAHAPH